MNFCLDYRLATAVGMRGYNAKTQTLMTERTQTNSGSTDAIADDPSAGRVLGSVVVVSQQTLHLLDVLFRSCLCRVYSHDSPLFFAGIRDIRRNGRWFERFDWKRINDYCVIGQFTVGFVTARALSPFHTCLVFHSLWMPTTRMAALS